MCRLTWSSSSLAVLTRGPRTQRLQPNHVIFVSKSSRRINYTQETAEPLGVSPPEAVDLLLIKNIPFAHIPSLPTRPELTSAQLLPLLSATTALEDFPEVMAGKLNRERHIPDRDRPHGPYFAKGHRFLLAIDPEHAYALISDILVIGREELCYRL